MKKKILELSKTNIYCRLTVDVGFLRVFIYERSKAKIRGRSSRRSTIGESPESVGLSVGWWIEMLGGAGFVPAPFFLERFLTNDLCYTGCMKREQEHNYAFIDSSLNYQTLISPDKLKIVLVPNFQKYSALLKRFARKNITIMNGLAKKIGQK